MERLPIRIPLSLIDKATREDTNDSLRGLAFAIMIKANFVSSIFKDADTTSLMSYFHLKHDTLKNALVKALDMGLVRFTFRVDKNGKRHKDLEAVKFNKDGRSTIKLNICDSNFGKHIYIRTNLKDLHTQYAKSSSFQSINDVMDLLILAKTLTLFKKHNKIFDCQLRQACLKYYPEGGEKLFRGAKTITQYAYLYRDIQSKIPVGEINILNCGYSIDKMLNQFGAFVNRYKLRKLLHQSDQFHNSLFHVLQNDAYIDQTDRIKNAPWEYIHTSKNASVFDIFEAAYKMYDNRVEGMRQAYKKRFIDTDEDGNVINLFHDRGCYIAKGKKRCLVRPMANLYYLQCDPFVTTGKKHRRVKKTTTGKNKYALPVSSVNAHVSTEELPY